MPGSLTAGHRRQLDEAFQRLLQQLGFPNGLPLSFTDMVQGGMSRDTEVVNLWVDAAAGSDRNPGSQDQPLKTLKEAFSRVPFLVYADHNINVKAGTYAETLDLSHVFVGSAQIKVVGVDFTTPTLASGVTSGTFDASFGSPTIPNTASVAGAGWTANDLKARFFKITSGTHNGKYFPAAANAATTVDFAMPADRTSPFDARDLRSQTFQIVEPAAIISRQGTASRNALIVCPQGLLTSAATGGQGHRFEKLTFDGSSGASSNIRIGNGARPAFVSCLFKGTTGSNFIGTSVTSGLHLEECYISVAANQIAIQPATNGVVSMQSCVVTGGTKVSSGSAGVAWGNVSGIFQDQTQSCFEMGFGARFIAFTHLVTRNSPIGFIMFGQGQVAVVTSAGCGFMLNHSTAAVQMLNQVLATGQIHGAGNALSLKNATIDGCGTGISISGSNNYLELENSTKVQNNTAWGVNMAAAKTAGLNTVVTDSTVAMSGNTSGDFTLDGVAATSLADLRADGDKTLLETTARLNRLTEI